MEILEEETQKAVNLNQSKKNVKKSVLKSLYFTSGMICLILLIKKKNKVR